MTPSEPNHRFKDFINGLFLSIFSIGLFIRTQQIGNSQSPTINNFFDFIINWLGVIFFGFAAFIFFYGAFKD